MVTSHLVTVGAGVKRPSGKRGSTARAAPSVLSFATTSTLAEAVDVSETGIALSSSDHAVPTAAT